MPVRRSKSRHCLNHGLRRSENGGDYNKAENRDLPNTESSNVVDQNIIEAVDSFRHFRLISNSVFSINFLRVFLCCFVAQVKFSLMLDAIKRSSFPEIE